MEVINKQIDILRLSGLDQFITQDVFMLIATRAYSQMNRELKELLCASRYVDNLGRIVPDTRGKVKLITGYLDASKYSIHIPAYVLALPEVTRKLVQSIQELFPYDVSEIVFHWKFHEKTGNHYAVIVRAE